MKIKTKRMVVKMTPADLALLKSAAKKARHPVTTWARGLLVSLAVWQLSEEKDFKLSPEHEHVQKTMELFGRHPSRRGKKAA